MTNKPPVTVTYSSQFKRDIKRLFKKYRTIQRDVQALIEQLQQGETPGDQIQGVNYVVYKVRMRNSDLTRGKSGGYRVIYYIQTRQQIVFVTMYVKNEQADISRDDIRVLLSNLDS